MGKLEFSFPDRFQYVCKLLDDYFRHTFFVFLRHRDEASAACDMDLHELGQTQLIANNFQFEEEIITIHSDRAKQYKSL